MMRQARVRRTGLLLEIHGYAPSTVVILQNDGVHELGAIAVASSLVALPAATQRQLGLAPGQPMHAAHRRRENRRRWCLSCVAIGRAEDDVLANHVHQGGYVAGRPRRQPLFHNDELGVRRQNCELKLRSVEAVGLLKFDTLE